MISSATSSDVVMPQMGVSVTEGTIVSWLKAPGEEVGADEPLCEVSTDKVDVEVPSPAAGVLEEIIVNEGETVDVGTVLARITSAGGAAAGETAAVAEGRGGAIGAAEAPGELDRSGFYSPVVRRIAAEHHVDLSRVHGHGVGGRVRKRDLLDHIRRGGNGRPLHTESPYRPDEAGASATAERPASRDAGLPDRAEPSRPAGPAAGDSPPAPGGLEQLIGPSRRELMDPMRAAIARHMVESRRAAAHCTTVVEADFSAVTRERALQREAMRARGVPLTYLAFVAKAAVEGLTEHPILNASVEGSEIVIHDDINLGIAVELEAGLVVPVIRRAQRLSLEGLAAALGDVAERARSGRIAPDDLAGGTFTITNPGQFGAVLATPIIHQPQVAILDLEAIVRRPVVVAGPDGAESIGIRPMSYLCMSWDHRALDGADAARFLSGVRTRLEAGGIR